MGMVLMRNAIRCCVPIVLIAACHPLPGPGERLMSLDAETFPVVLGAIRAEADSLRGEADSIAVSVVLAPVRNGIGISEQIAAALVPVSERDLALRRAEAARHGMQVGPAAGPPLTCAGPLVPPAPDGTMPDRSGCPHQQSLTVALGLPWVRSTADTMVVEAWMSEAGPGGATVQSREYVLARSDATRWAVLRYVVIWIIE
jgi:hypothetical protein